MKVGDKVLVMGEVDTICDTGEVRVGFKCDSAFYGTIYQVVNKDQIIDPMLNISKEEVAKNFVEAGGGEQ